MSDLIAELKAEIGKKPAELKLYELLFDSAVNAGDWRTSEWLREELLQNYDKMDLARCLELIKRALLFEARNLRFDSYMRVVEWKRRPERKFYEPRQHYLKPVVEAYQQVADGELDLLVVCMIKRAGKSQCFINFLNMMSGKFPNKSSLLEGAGDALVRSFYKGCLEYIENKDEYCFFEIFPDAKPELKGGQSYTNADLKTINLAKQTRFPTLMFRSIDATQVGLSEANLVMGLDDCVEGREMAKNRDLLEKRNEIIFGDVLGRRTQGTPIIATGTNYSIHDPIEKLIEKAVELGWRYKVVKIPALDPITDKSNYEFVLDGKPMFTTEYFHNERKLLSEEQWESEFQQQPFEAKGILFKESELNYFYELPPDREPDTTICVCDTAERGKDFTAMPVAKIYGDDVYIVDVVYDNGQPEITKPACANTIIRNGVVAGTWESNSAGEYYAKDVMDILKSKNYRFNMRTKRTISNKQTRIEFASDGIKKHFFFKHPTTYERGGQYWHFMREVTGYVRIGKVKNDDAVDSLSLLESEIRLLSGNKIRVFDRFF